MSFLSLLFLFLFPAAFPAILHFFLKIHFTFSPQRCCYFRRQPPARSRGAERISCWGGAEGLAWLGPWGAVSITPRMLASELRSGAAVGLAAPSSRAPPYHNVAFIVPVLTPTDRLLIMAHLRRPPSTRCTSPRLASSSLLQREQLLPTRLITDLLLRVEHSEPWL